MSLPDPSMSTARYVSTPDACDPNHRPIGGHFDLDLAIHSSAQNPDWTAAFHLDRNAVLVASGRSAFRVILEEMQLKDKILLMPDYLCGDAQIPVLGQQGIRYRFYPVSDDFTISATAMGARLTPEIGAVLMINYFGLKDHRALATQIRAYNPAIQIIEDNSQAFYGMARQVTPEHWADFSFSSFGKSFCLPDGGCVRAKQALKTSVPEPSSRQGVAALLGAILKHEYLNAPAHAAQTQEHEQRFLELFDTAAREVCEAPARMTALSYALMERYPFADWMQRRRDNYRHLAAAIRDIPQLRPVFGDLEQDQVPLFLPVRVSATMRDALRTHLRGQAIYCPVHWPLVPELDQPAHRAAKELSQTLLSLPIDHRLDLSDIERLAQSIKAFWRKSEN